MAAAQIRTRRYEEISVGEELPVLEVPITTTRIVAGAIASRDYQVVHHDPRLAVERGSRDLFMNILTTNGYVGRYVTDWAGPEALLRSVDIRLGVPNYPGDLMQLSGSVVEKRDGIVTVELRGRNELGDHVTGRVELELSATSAAS
jgi:acyl dehydratase